MDELAWSGCGARLCHRIVIPLQACWLQFLVLCLQSFLPTSFDVCFGLLEAVEAGRRFLEVFILINVFSTCFALFPVFNFFSFFFYLSSLMLMYCILQATSVFNIFQLVGGIRHKINLVSY